MAGGLREWMHRVIGDVADAAAVTDDLVEPDDTRMCDCCAGTKVQVLGRVRSVELRPHDDAPALVAELYDGTDSVELVWLGRRSIGGIEAGRSLRAVGRVATRGGHKAIYNPKYELFPVAP